MTMFKPANITTRLLFQVLRLSRTGSCKMHRNFMVLPGPSKMHRNFMVMSWPSKIHRNFIVLPEPSKLHRQFLVLPGPSKIHRNFIVLPGPSKISLYELSSLYHFHIIHLLLHSVTPKNICHNHSSFPTYCQKFPLYLQTP